MLDLKHDSEAIKPLATRLRRYEDMAAKLGLADPVLFSEPAILNNWEDLMRRTERLYYMLNGDKSKTMLSSTANKIHLASFLERKSKHEPLDPVSAFLNDNTFLGEDDDGSRSSVSGADSSKGNENQSRNRPASKPTTTSSGTNVRGNKVNSEIDSFAEIDSATSFAGMDSSGGGDTLDNEGNSQDKESTTSTQKGAGDSKASTTKASQRLKAEVGWAPPPDDSPSQDFHVALQTLGLRNADVLIDDEVRGDVKDLEDMATTLESNKLRAIRTIETDPSNDKILTTILAQMNKTAASQ